MTHSGQRVPFPLTFAPLLEQAQKEPFGSALALSSLRAAVAAAVAAAAAAAVAAAVAAAAAAAVAVGAVWAAAAEEAL